MGPFHSKTFSKPPAISRMNGIFKLTIRLGGMQMMYPGLETHPHISLNGGKGSIMID